MRILKLNLNHGCRFQVLQYKYELSEDHLNSETLIKTLDLGRYYERIAVFRLIPPLFFFQVCLLVGLHELVVTRMAEKSPNLDSCH